MNTNGSYTLPHAATDVLNAFSKGEATCQLFAQRPDYLRHAHLPGAGGVQR